MPANELGLGRAGPRLLSPQGREGGNRVCLRQVLPQTLLKHSQTPKSELVLPGDPERGCASASLLPSASHVQARRLWFIDSAMVAGLLISASPAFQASQNKPGSSSTKETAALHWSSAPPRPLVPFLSSSAFATRQQMSQEMSLYRATSLDSSEPLK